MRFTDGYAVETDDGRGYVRPMDTLLKAAISLVPRDAWTLCTRCARKCPLFFHDPESGTDFCAVCKLDMELGLGRQMGGEL